MSRVKPISDHIAWLYVRGEITGGQAAGFSDMSPSTWNKRFKEWKTKNGVTEIARRGHMVKELDDVFYTAADAFIEGRIDAAAGMRVCNMAEWTFKRFCHLYYEGALLRGRKYVPRKDRC